MSLNATQRVALKTELQTDPRGYGYNAVARNDTDMAARINLARDGSAGTVPTTPAAAGGNANGTIRLALATADTGQIRATVTFAAYNGLVTATQSWFQWVTNNGFILVNANMLQQLAGIPTAAGSIWASADRTATNAAMEALLRRYASRAEELFGLGVVATVDDVAAALNN